MLVDFKLCERTDLRKGDVAKEHFEAEDDGEREHLLCNLPVKFEEASSSNSS